MEATGVIGDDGSDADGAWEASPPPGPAGPLPGALPESVLFPVPGTLPSAAPELPGALPPGAALPDEPLSDEPPAEPPDSPPARKVPATMLSSPARVWIELS